MQQKVEKANEFAQKQFSAILETIAANFQVVTAGISTASANMQAKDLDKLGKSAKELGAKLKSGDIMTAKGGTNF